MNERERLYNLAERLNAIEQAMNAGYRSRLESKAIDIIEDARSAIVDMANQGEQATPQPTDEEKRLMRIEDLARQARNYLKAGLTEIAEELKKRLKEAIED